MIKVTPDGKIKRPPANKQGVMSMMGTCGDPSCDHVHILYYNSNQTPICEVVLSLEDIQAIQEEYDLMQSNRRPTQ